MDALWSHWEFMMINGDSSVSAAQIDGLAVLANTTGAGQSFAVTTGGDPLLDLDLAITKVFANGGCADVIVGNEAAMRKLAELVRASGYKPDYRICEQTGQLTLYYNGIPFCRSDHVKNVSTTVGPTTSLYIMALGEPNGVFAITSQDAPGIKFRETERSNPPFLSIRADLYAALVSTTDLALVELSGWPVSTPIFP